MSKSRKQKPLNLALQGGGAHGAFTWGVLDRLLEEEDIAIKAISGTSAGAMNAAVLVHGFMENGTQGAKDALAKFWREISGYSSIFNPIQQSGLEQLSQGWNLDFSMAYNMFDMFSRMFSPYETNPGNFNPLREVLERSVDMKSLRACSTIQLFVTATQVSTGQPRVFGCDEISIDALMASACIPFLFQAVEIEGEAYWDGGYVGNPSLWPLIYNTNCDDMLLVQINPIERPGIPKRSMDIINRLNEISFNYSLIAEMRAIHFVQKLIERGKLSDEEYHHVRMHLIESPETKHGLTASSKLNTDWEFFQFLHGLGRQSADDWLRDHKADIGKRSSVNVAQTFLQKKRTHEHV